MDNNVCELDLDGNTYFLPCDRVGDLSFRDGYLVNVSSSTITMKSVFDIDTSYPYIQCSSMSVCNLRTGYNSSSPITHEPTYHGDLFRIANLDLLIFSLLFILLGVKLIWKR